MATLSYAGFELKNGAYVVHASPRVKNFANAADQAAMSDDQLEAVMRHAPRIVIPSPIYRSKVRALDVIPKLLVLVRHCVEHPACRSSIGGDDGDGPNASALAFATNRSLRGAK